MQTAELKKQLRRAEKAAAAAAALAGEILPTRSAHDIYVQLDALMAILEQVGLAVRLPTMFMC